MRMPCIDSPRRFPLGKAIAVRRPARSEESSQSERPSGWTKFLGGECHQRLVDEWQRNYWSVVPRIRAAHCDESFWRCLPGNLASVLNLSPQGGRQFVELLPIFLGQIVLLTWIVRQVIQLLRSEGAVL